MARHRARLKAAGLCTAHKQPKPCAGCRERRDESNAYNRELRARHRAAGNCGPHGKPRPCARCEAIAKRVKAGQRRKWRRDRHEMLTALTARDGPGCFYCDTPFADEIDHVEPLRGERKGYYGPLRFAEPDNLRLACRSCNKRKHDRAVAAFVAELAADGLASARALAAYG